MEDLKDKIYDLIIVGAGPAGMGASIYSSRYKLDHVIFGNEIGGQVIETHEIENWPGEISITGKDFADKLRKHAEHLGGKIVQADVSGIIVKDGVFEVVAGDKKYSAKSIILALGMKPRKMNVPGEDKFIGKGVSYCATCDAAFFREKDVVVVGGGDAAAVAAVHLTEFARSVKVIYRDTYSFEPAWEDKILKNPKIELICCSNVTEIVGDQKVTGIKFETKEGLKEMATQGVFIEVGATPGVMIAQNLGVALDDQSYIIVDQTQATNVERVYAAGDVTTGSNKFRQMLTAAAEGAIAAGSVYRKLRLNK